MDLLALDLLRVLPSLRAGRETRGARSVTRMGECGGGGDGASAAHRRGTAQRVEARGRKRWGPHRDVVRLQPLEPFLAEPARSCCARLSALRGAHLVSSLVVIVRLARTFRLRRGTRAHVQGGGSKQARAQDASSAMREHRLRGWLLGRTSAVARTEIIPPGGGMIGRPGNEGSASPARIERLRR